MRSYCSISEEAVRITSESGIESRIRRPESMPASTSSDSAFRRIRVARWSSRNRFARAFGSSSVRSSESMNDSCRLRRTWSRRATLMNISAIDPRRAACSCATCSVVALTALNASARRPTSSRDSTGICTSSMPGPSPGTATSSTSFGSCSRTSAAAAVRRRSGFTMPRETNSAKANERPTASNPTPAVPIAWVRADDDAWLAMTEASVKILSRTESMDAIWSAIPLSHAVLSSVAISDGLPFCRTSRMRVNSGVGKLSGMKMLFCPRLATTARALVRSSSVEDTWVTKSCTVPGELPCSRMIDSPIARSRTKSSLLRSIALNERR